MTNITDCADYPVSGDEDDDDANWGVDVRRCVGWGCARGCSERLIGSFRYLCK